MFSFRRFTILLLVAVIFTAVAAAQSGSQREMTIEESYLQDSIEIMIIKEMSRGTSREHKIASLDYIGDALERGNKSDEIRQTLEFLSMEGTRSTARERGRVMNNYTDVRRRAVRYLGMIGNEESRKTIISVLEVEREPMVIVEAIRALGDIGTNVNNETVRNICWVINRNLSTNADNSMVMAFMGAIKNIIRKNNGLNNSPEAIQTLMRISEAPLFNNEVKTAARQLLAELRAYGRQ